MASGYTLGSMQEPTFPVTPDAPPPGAQSSCPGYAIQSAAESMPKLEPAAPGAVPVTGQPIKGKGGGGYKRPTKKRIRPPEEDKRPTKQQRVDGGGHSAALDAVGTEMPKEDPQRNQLLRNLVFPAAGEWAEPSKLGGHAAAPHLTSVSRQSVGR